MKKKIRFFLRVIFKYTIGFLLFHIFKRNKNTWVFNSMVEGTFMLNAKYMYLHVSSNNSARAVWISESDKVVKTLRAKGYKAYNKFSLKGIFYLLRAQYYFTDLSISNLSLSFSYGAKVINLWHGIPLKKIGYDDGTNFITKLSPLENYFYKTMNNLKDQVIMTNGDYDRAKYISAFKSNRVFSLGYPRNDALFREFENQDIFMEQEARVIKNLKKQGKKLLFYLPTYRDTGRDISGWLNSSELKKVLSDNNAVLIFKLHSYDKNIIDINGHELYKLPPLADIYGILKEMDILITDYSSVYFDYLLLDRPIIFYPFDLKEYIAQDRALYVNYDDYTPGVKAYNENELIEVIERSIKGEDNFKQNRAKIRSEVFLHNDGNACERIVEFVKNLDK